MGLNREMSTILRGSKNVKTVTFPGTVKAVSRATFEGNKLLESVILNEGLEKLEGYQGAEYKYNSHGVFAGTRIKQIILPATLRILGDNTFAGCKQLKQVISRERGEL